ncbi:MAG: dihydrolipoyl dehydrogenase [Planctomycetota bacterium]|jgi:dihydrolipoamide dehydrogenase|nr:dihydrolipoyl dehydrogenase [Planctomycetota bacterium]
MPDLIVLGGGPAGYVAAEHAARLGKSVVLVERDRLGGTCLNRGCVPTKAYLHAAKLYHHALNSQAFGVTVREAAFDYGRLKERTDKLKETLGGGIAGLLRKRRVELAAGEGEILDKNRVRVGDKVYEGDNLLIATGSAPAWPPIPGVRDNPAVVDSTGLLELSRPAASLVVIGGGVIGTEFACFHSLLGIKAAIVEMLPRLCGNLDSELAQALQRKLESRGTEIHLDARVDRLEGGEVFFTDSQGRARSVAGERILLAAGRVPILGGFGLENLNLDVGREGIRVNDRAETSLPGVYAAGDVTGKFPLAHFASRQGLVAVENLSGKPAVCRESAIPAVVYGDPEIATVGLTREGAEARGIFGRAVKMPLAASGRFLAETEGERGFVKAVLGRSDVLLGMQVIGPYASEMIGAAAVMIENEMRAGDIRELVFPHPTVAEILRDVMSG